MIPEILSKKIKDKYDVVNNTFISKRKDYEVEIGDSKQADFLPQVKIKRWENEANFSLRLMEDNAGAIVKTNGDKIEWKKGNKTVRFYEKHDNSDHKLVEPETVVRFFNRGIISPDELTAEYELTVNSSIASVSFLDREGLFLYGGQDARSYYETEKLKYPLYRFRTSHHGNPMYFDGNIGCGMYHFKNQPNNHAELMQALFDAVRKTLSKYSVTVFDNGKSKMFFENDGKQYKFLSAVIENNKLVFYLNFNTDYDRSLIFYKDGVPSDTKDVAGGLHAAENIIPKTVLEEVLQNLLSDKTVVDSTFTADEFAQIAEIKKKTNNEKWIIEGERDDDLFPEAKDGAFEFDIEIASKPTSNVVSFSMQTKGLVFYKQPPLSAEEKFKGVKRAANVIGSLAVYHQKQAGDFSAIGGQNYETGKAFHIYRPRIFDAMGKWVFGELEIDEENSLLHVIIPDGFLHKAIYPILVDPTFGYSTIGASTAVVDDDSVTTHHAGYFPLSEAGDVTGISVYLTSSTGSTQNVQTQIRADNAGLPGTQQGSTSQNGSGSTPAWIPTTFASSISLTAGSWWLCISNSSYVGGDQYDSTSIHYDSGGTGASGAFGSYSSNSNKYSIYATYTSSGGGTSISTFAFIKFP